ncbi:hypothetical protein IW261DRAFT_1455946 [Armillaria novae-zelandiae]|uniref:Peptidase C14 caspase domain-containing protein n=1 Tax=Armillaria novae-zelandiae TaxID=153914 RepID=A0AA39TFR9_9AGAR|nr:hypothetical protein IW261DRAFT_1455946 [Armillaria novae-zelandiae]
MLAPHDFLKGGSNDLKRGQGLPNVRLSRLLQDIANKKSDNITVILDCCHSGSGTRTGDDDETFAVRGIDLPASYTVPDELLPDPDARESGIAEGHKNAGLLSHVLLSACQAGQRAREEDRRGVFTSALLEVLQEHAVNKLTYTDVINNLRDLPAQNPQCEGENKSRYLFNSRVTSPHREIHPIHAVQPGDLDVTPGQYILEAGEAYGITKNAEFVVFADKTKALECAWESALGTVVAVKTTAFKTTCDLSPRGDKTQPFPLSAPGFALQALVGEKQDVRLFIELAPELVPVFMRIAEEMQSVKEGKRGFSLVKSRDDTPDLIVTVNGDHVHFEIMEERSREHRLRHMPLEVKIDDPEAIHRVLQSSADFFWHLRRSSPKSPLAKKVGLECTKLTETDDYADDLEAVLMPDPNGDNLNVGGVIRVDVDEKAKYGFRITNTSAVPLYVSMFYFDMSDLSISSYYQPGYAKKNVDVSLPKKCDESSIPGSLTIGYGASGTVPHRYTLRERQDVDVGFLKVFFSKNYLDLSGIVQKSPFEEGRASEEDKARTMEDLWHTICVPVVQTRGGRLV